MAAKKDKCWHHEWDDQGVCSVCGKERDQSEGGRPPGVAPVVGDDGLTFRERDVLHSHQTNPGWTYQQIGDDLGISRQQVGQVVNRLRKKGKWQK